MAAALCAVFLVLAAACGGSNIGSIFGRQYEYEEDLSLSLDGSATLIINSSIPALIALRGLALDPDVSARVDEDALRAAYTSPVSEVVRIGRPWRRNNRRFVQIRLKVSDIRRLNEAKPLSWSQYGLELQNDQYVFTQKVGPSAFKPGTLQNVGWNGKELVGFRVHLPSRIKFHNARDLDTNETGSPERGNILRWEQHLADRLDGAPVNIRIEMDKQSILHRTLWLFAGAFTAAVAALILAIWLVVRRGSRSEAPDIHN